MIKEYEAIVPGSGQAIFDMFQKQVEHRMSQEKFAVRQENLRSWGGLICGFLVACLGLVGSVVLGIHGDSVTASVIGGGTLVSLVGVFVLGKNATVKERLERTKILSGKR